MLLAVAGLDQDAVASIGGDKGTELRQPLAEAGGRGLCLLLVVEPEEGALMFGYFPDIDDPDVIHCIQVYEDWEALCHHMREPRYMQYVDPIMAIAAPGSPEYSYGSCLFMHRGTGHIG